MTTETKRTGAHKFVALELSLEIVDKLRDVVGLIRKRYGRLADQIVRAAGSVAANLAEAGGRQGKDRVHCFSASQRAARTKPWFIFVSRRVGMGAAQDVQAVLALIDRELAILWRLTH